MNIKRILIGIDDSKYAENAAKYGFDLARTFGAEVGLVHIIEPVPLNTALDDSMLGTANYVIPGDVDTVELIDVQTQHSESVISRVIKAFGQDLTVSQFTEFGSTSEGIITCCQEFGAELIVLGTHSRSGLDRLLMGSIAEHVVRHSHIPVLVVPFNEAAN